MVRFQIGKEKSKSINETVMHKYGQPGHENVTESWDHRQENVSESLSVAYTTGNRVIASTSTNTLFRMITVEYDVILCFSGIAVEPKVLLTGRRATGAKTAPTTYVHIMCISLTK